MAPVRTRTPPGNSFIKTVLPLSLVRGLLTNSLSDGQLSIAGSILIFEVRLAISTVGLTISIPIFSNRQYKTAYNKAKYAITTSQLELLNTQKQLLQTVEGIYLDATSSQTQYTSATERLSYVKESYNLIDEQFSLGMKNTLELLTEKNNYLTAQQEQLQAKYMALMSVQLLNVYQKKPVAENY